MNMRRVVQALKLQESLTEDERGLLGTLQLLTPTERELLVESLQPQKAATECKPRAGSKSPRATALGQQLKSNLEQRAKEPICTTCGNDESYTDHSQPSPSYHEFQAARTTGAKQ